MKEAVNFFRSVSWINFIVRNIIKYGVRLGKLFEKLSFRFRVHGVVALQMEGIRIKCFCKADDFMANGIYYQNDFEENEFRLIRELVVGARHYVDVGAYTGLFSIFVAKTNPSIQVYCVEPHPNNCHRIKKNISLNELSNIQTFQVALGSETRQIEFTIPTTESLSMVGSANSPFSEAFQPLQRKVIQAEQVTLDNLLKDVDILPNDLIKIDVEYYELSVLTGALNILKLKRPMLLVEIILSERLFYYKPEMRGKINELHAIEIESLLKHIGYFPYQILRDGVYRVDSVVNCPDTRDFLFSTSSGVERFIPIEKVAAYFSGE